MHRAGRGNGLRVSCALVLAWLTAALGTPAPAAGPASPAAGTAGRAVPPALAAALYAHSAYVAAQAEEFVQRTRAFVDAVKAGRLSEAKALYAPARLPYERIESAAALFPDLVKRMDVRADEFELRERDPAFIGFHRLELSLFRDGIATGLSETAERLASDSAELRERLLNTSIPAGRAVGSASALIESIAATKISGEEERYSRTDLWDFQGNIEGSKAVFLILQPLLEKDRAFVARIAQNYRRVEDVLARYRTADGGFAPYDHLSPRDRNALKGPITLLAEDLSTLRARLDLD